MNVWQIAAGEPGRDYRELFLDHDIMIMGPSERGEVKSNNYAIGPAHSPQRQVHHFANDPKPGDRVLMRLAHEVIAVGQIPAEPEHQYYFDTTYNCVYGWHLGHRRRVIWAEGYKLGELADVYRKAFQKPTFTQVHEQGILKIVRNIESTYFERSLKELPNVDTSTYTDDDLGNKLFQAGISNKNITDIIIALNQAERLCSWYSKKAKSGRIPSESEVITHIILPILLGLGWSHQQIAVEWNHVDIAFFKQMPSKSENCIMILEAKDWGSPLINTLEQPKKYIDNLKLKNVKHILTADGENLYMYEKSADNWSPNPVGYINVKLLQKQYALPKGTDLVNTLVSLQPSVL
jgi:hypothetical protein